MANFNKVILAGNLSRDIDLRYTPKGSAVCESALAVNHSWKTDDGKSMDECSFIDFTVFGRRAEVLAQYVKKGKQLLIEGRLKQESWTDKQSGQKRSKLKVVVENFQFLSPSDKAGSGGSHVQQDAPDDVQNAPQDDETPF